MVTKIWERKGGGEMGMEHGREKEMNNGYRENGKGNMKEGEMEELRQNKKETSWREREKKETGK